MYEFDPQNVNFDELKMPAQLRKLSTSGKEFVKDFSFKLSRMSQDKRFVLELLAANDLS
jgi:hypothetical protein